MGKKLIFIRDDDVYKHSERFVNLFNFFKKYKIPVIYAVVPNLIEKKIIHFLNKEKKNNPKLFDIIQHGWNHKNYSKNLNNKYEFGKSRSYLQQKKDLLNGYRKMTKLFGRNFSPAFAPPYHGYNQITLKIINELKIPIFSAGNKVKIKNKSFLDLPAQISINNYDKNGKPLALNSKSMIKKFLSHLGQDLNVQGIVFHHNAISNKKQFKELKIFFLFLKKLINENKIKLVLFSQFL